MRGRDELHEPAGVLLALIRDAHAPGRDTAAARGTRHRVLRMTGWMLTRTRNFGAAAAGTSPPGPGAEQACTAREERCAAPAEAGAAHRSPGTDQGYCSECQHGKGSQYALQG